MLRGSRWRAASECSACSESPDGAQRQSAPRLQGAQRSECSEAPDGAQRQSAPRLQGAQRAPISQASECSAHPSPAESSQCSQTAAQGPACVFAVQAMNAPLTHEASRRACARLPWKSVIHTVSLSRQAVCQSISHSYSKSKQTAFCQTFDFT